jgi:tetratricopeptide (TPR) repeat protein
VARNIDRKQLKNPDQFVSFWTHVGAFLNKHRMAVLAGVGGLVLVGVGVWAVTTVSAKHAAEDSAAFGRIERVANADLLPATGEGPKSDDGLPHFKTEEARFEAALKEADTFLSQHGGSDLKAEALLLKARFLLALGKNSEALAIYQGQLGGIDARLRFLAHEGLGYALEANGQLDAAISAFSALADESQAAAGFYRDRALFNKARLLEKKGSAKEAEKLLHEILQQTPTTTLKEEINDRLAALEGK